MGRLSCAARFIVWMVVQRYGLAAMCETYELLHDTGTVSNQTEGALTLTDTQRAWVNKIYDQDFTSFGYEKR